MTGTRRAAAVRPTCAVPRMPVNIRRPWPDGNNNVRTNLMATGWLVIKFVPTVFSVPLVNISYGSRKLTLEDDTEGALADLLADAIVNADDVRG